GYTPRRPRAWPFYWVLADRRWLGLLSRVAYSTLHAHVGALLGEADAAPGVISLGAEPRVLGALASTRARGRDLERRPMISSSKRFGYGSLHCRLLASEWSISWRPVPYR